MPSSIRVLALFAHPDDAEFLCAGTLAHLVDRGASLHIATMTAGDCGSSVLTSAKISRIRRAEAERGAALLNAPYTCLEELDLLVLLRSSHTPQGHGACATSRPRPWWSPTRLRTTWSITKPPAASANPHALALRRRTSAPERAALLTPPRTIPHLYYSPAVQQSRHPGKRNFASLRRGYRRHPGTEGKDAGLP